MLQLKSVGLSLPFLQLQVLKATMQSRCLDNYHLLFTSLYMNIHNIHKHTCSIRQNTVMPKTTFHMNYGLQNWIQHTLKQSYMQLKKKKIPYLNICAQ